MIYIQSQYMDGTNLVRANRNHSKRVLFNLNDPCFEFDQTKLYIHTSVWVAIYKVFRVKYIGGLLQFNCPSNQTTETRKLRIMHLKYAQIRGCFMRRYGQVPIYFIVAFMVSPLAPGKSYYCLDGSDANLIDRPEYSSCVPELMILPLQNKAQLNDVLVGHIMSVIIWMCIDCYHMHLFNIRFAQAQGDTYRCDFTDKFVLADAEGELTILESWTPPPTFGWSVR